MKDHGLTLLELLISLSIVAILLAVALPNFSELVLKSQLEQAHFVLKESIETTRSTAVFMNKRTVLKASPNWEAGWILFVDDNNDGIKDPDEPILLERHKLKAVKVQDNFKIRNQISFIGSGEPRKPGRIDSGGFDAGTFTLCTDRGDRGIKLVLNRAGRLRSEKISAAECSPNT